MAWDRKTSDTKIGGSSLYAYLEVEWKVRAANCSASIVGGVTSPVGGWENTPQGTLYWRVKDPGDADYGVWHEYTHDSAGYSGPGDLKLVETADTFARFSAGDRKCQLSCDVYAVTSTGSGTGSAIMTYEIPHLPKTPTGLTATRVSDNQIDLSWTNPSTSYYAFCLEVSIDGGAWSQCWYYNGAGYPTSYSYTAASADHSYKFRCRTEYESAYSAYSSETALITMSPLPPASITTAAVAGGTDIAVTLENASAVATSLEWEVSTDGKATWSAGSTSPVAGTPVTSFTATGITGTAYIRVRNVNSTGSSAWLVSESVTTICPPAAPTIIAPSGSIVNIADGSMTIEWIFNSLDGSTQTAYEVSLSKNGGAAVTQSGTTAHRLKITFSGLAPNAGDTLAFKVRTKGADANWSDWSSTKTVTFYTPPTLTITSPASDITGMPLNIVAAYTDMTGYKCNSATVTVKSGGKSVTKAATVNNSSSPKTVSASFGVSEFLPDNGAQVEVSISATSSSSLQTSTNGTFNVAFVEPKAGELQITNDPETGYANLTATFEQSPDILADAVWELGALNTNNGADVSATNRARTTAVTSVTTNRKYLIEGTGEVNVHRYSNGTWQAQLGSWQPLPYIYDAAQYDGVRVVMRNADNSDVDLTAIDITMTQDSYVGANQTEFFSHALDDTTYWFSATNVNAYGTQLTDGWAHYDYNAKNINFSPRKWRVPLEPSTEYTVMLEVRNTTAMDATTFFVYTGTNSVWQSGGNVVVTGDGVYRVKGTTKSDLTLSTITHVRVFIGDGASTPANDTEADFRLSLYEGDYTGEYQPFTEIAQPRSISVSRVNADGITPLIEDGASGSGVVDKYAPLNTQYQYAVTTTSDVNAIKTVYVDNEIITDLWFAYWTHKDGDIVTDMAASAKWNPDNGGIQIARPQKTRVYYAGRKDPVSYDGAAVSLNETPSWMIVERSEIQPFVQLIEDGGRGVYKSCDGWVYHADFDLTLTPKYTAIGYYGGIGLSVTRIAGERL